MRLFPAIDLLGGRVVRLYQGDYAQSEAYGDDPAAFAARFAAAGAQNLHLVDLDGARTGRPQNFAAAAAIAATGRFFTELGGGIRSEEAVARALEAGVGRVILGTAALKDPAFTRRMLKAHPGRIAIGVDARGGRVAVEGWLATFEVDSFDFCKEMMQCGAEYVIYTDIARDGAGRGPNLSAYEKLAGIAGLKVTASGGVSTLEDIRALRSLGLYAAIVGRAIYTGAIDLAAALEAAGDIPASATHEPSEVPTT